MDVPMQPQCRHRLSVGGWKESFSFNHCRRSRLWSTNSPCRQFNYYYLLRRWSKVMTTNISGGVNWQRPETLFELIEFPFRSKCKIILLLLLGWKEFHSPGDGKLVQECIFITPWSLPGRPNTREGYGTENKNSTPFNFLINPPCPCPPHLFLVVQVSPIEHV